MLGNWSGLDVPEFLFLLFIGLAAGYGTAQDLGLALGFCVLSMSGLVTATAALKVPFWLHLKQIMGLPCTVMVLLMVYPSRTGMSRVSGWLIRLYVTVM